MSGTGPRPLAKIAALASGLAVTVIAVIALWNYLSGSGGDTPGTRNAVITPVRAAVDAAAAHSDTCTKGFTDMARAGAPANSAFDATMATLAPCGTDSRSMAERGYMALDAATGGPDESPLRDAFLESAGSILSVYEMQGDDFDVIYDLLRGARADPALVASLGSDVNNMLGSSASDIAAAQDQLERAQALYHAGG